MADDILDYLGEVNLSVLYVGGLVLISVLLYMWWLHRIARKEEKGVEALNSLRVLGEVVPDSMYPRIDTSRCIGSGACVAACPEKDVLSVVGGIAHLISPMACVGHGACQRACPVKAIDLVFGSERRGVELPAIDPNFETDRPGIFIVGELGGMGLIRNAVAQGAQVAKFISQGLRRGDGASVLDAVVVGAGPAGMSATLGLLDAGLRVQLLEREQIGGTIMHYPRAKVVMTGTLDLPIYGTVRRRRMSKEQLVDVWNQIGQKVELPAQTGVLVKGIEPLPSGAWRVVAETGASWVAANVVLALGRRGSPRRLGVPGEDLSKVAYRLLEPTEFNGKDVLVVGGGNSAVECAIALADQASCNSVSISYRRPAFGRCRAENKTRIAEVIASGQVRALMPSQVVQIDGDTVTLQDGDNRQFSVPNTAVIVQIGGTPPGEILSSFGVQTVTKYGTA